MYVILTHFQPLLFGFINLIPVEGNFPLDFSITTSKESTLGSSGGFSIHLAVTPYSSPSIHRSPLDLPANDGSRRDRKKKDQEMTRTRSADQKCRGKWRGSVFRNPLVHLDVEVRRQPLEYIPPAP